MLVLSIITGDVSFSIARFATRKKYRPVSLQFSGTQKVRFLVYVTATRRYFPLVFLCFP